LALITKQELKPFLNIDSATEDYDSVINTIISSVGKDVQRICNQDIESTSQTLELNGNGTCYLLIPKFPVISITTLKHRSEILDLWTSHVAISSTTYQIVYINNVAYLYYSEGFIEGIANYQLVYISGYATVPQDIKQIAIEMSVIYFKNFDINSGVKGGRLGLNSIAESVQGVSATTQFRDLSQDWFKRLSKYRKPSL